MAAAAPAPVALPPRIVAVSPQRPVAQGAYPPVLQQSPSPRRAAVPPLAGPRPAAPSPAARSGGSGSRAGSQSPRRRGAYARGDLVDYHSGSYQSWVPAQVVEVNPETGAITLDVKQSPIKLQEQHLLVRPRVRPQQAHLEWMHAVMREGRIDDEAQVLFNRYASAEAGAHLPSSIRQDALPAVASEMDDLLGVCGSMKGLIIELRRGGRESLFLDGFVSAFWEQLTFVCSTYGNTMPRQHDGFRRRENPLNAYQFARCADLGSGTYGKVKLVLEKRTQAKRAMKIINKSSFGGCLELLEAEIENLCLVDHPNIAKLYECFEDKESIYLIMDFCSGGELQGKINDARRKRTNLSEAFASDVMRQVVLAIVHIHAHGIVHLDIKSANIMLMPSKRTLPPISGEQAQTLEMCYDNPHVMVIDLGVSQVFRPGNFRHNNPMGTPATMAPEVWQGEITPKADVFSCGIVLYELLALQLPFPDVPCNPAGATRFWSMNPPANWFILQQSSREGVEICAKMMACHRQLRPTASQCLAYPFLADVSGPALREVPAELARRVLQLPEHSVLYKSVSMSLARRWPANQWPSVKRWFDALSSAGGGRVERAQVAAALQRVGAEAIHAGKAADAMDFDCDGSVGWTEFVAACIDLSGAEFDATLREAFDEADSDDDGLLTPHDLGKLLPLHHAAELARDVFQGLTGRTEDGARLDWTTFRRHFTWSSGRLIADGTNKNAAGASPTGFRALDFFGMAKDAAGKVRSRWFPTPGDPEQEEEHLRQLAAMGFTDREQCLEVLRRHANQLSSGCIEELCSLNR